MSILLKNGIIVTFTNNSTQPTVLRADVLINHNKITQISPSIDIKEEDQMIDATGMLVCPGFVDTHRHLWQTQFRAYAGDMSLAEYMGKLKFGPSRFYTPEDAYIGQLAGALEAVYGGITTVVDHAHLSQSTKHVEELLRGTVDSGIRSMFCYTLQQVVENAPGIVLSNGNEWQMKQLEELSSKMPGDGRITLGLGWDAFGGSPDSDRETFNFARSHNIKPITFHYGSNGTKIKYLVDNHLLQSDCLPSHANGITDVELSFIKAHNAGISSTPEDELAMSHGNPIAFRAKRAGCRVGLGVDCASIVSGDLFAPMRFALQYQRGHDNEVLRSRKKIPKYLSCQSSDVFRMGTLGGAEAVGRQDEIGSIEEGKLADIILIRTDSPNLVAFNDPFRAIVLYANPSDVDTVIVNGEILKKGGKIIKVDWQQVAARLVQSKEKIMQQAKSMDLEAMYSAVRQLLHLEDSTEEWHDSYQGVYINK